MTQPSYYLAEHVFICLVERYCVFLDLKQDRYLCLERRQMDALAGRLKGWPEPQVRDAPPNGEAEPDASHAFALLIRHHMLTTDECSGKAAIPTVHTTPHDALAQDVPKAPVKTGHLPTFFTACTRAATDLRWRDIAHGVARVKCRKQRDERPLSRPDLKVTHDLVLVFKALRPWFSRNYLCLFDSLALIDFLAIYGLFPAWVFGIRMDPFEAHCWVQQDDLVLNDTVDHVRSFSPIMVV